MYKPHVFGVQVGQNVEFVNSDATAHNVHALPNVNRSSISASRSRRRRTRGSSRRREVMVRFKCDMHNWMSAYAGVLEHPYFAVTTPGGEFELKNLPAGHLHVEAWHEKLGTADAAGHARRERKESGDVHIQGLGSDDSRRIWVAMEG